LTLIVPGLAPNRIIALHLKCAVSVLCLFAVASRLAAARGDPADTRDRPNVLFIAIDDLRPALGCYGENEVISPNIDRLAKSGMVFDRAYCQFPLCAPSRASLLTGTRPATTKVTDLYTDFRVNLENAPTLPQWFKQHGYHTDRVGKIFHIDDVASWTPARPAQRFGPAEPAKRAPYASAAINETGWAKFDRAKADGVTGMALERSQRGPAFEIAEVDEEELEDGRIAREAIATLGNLADRGSPFFLAVGFNKPHLPFVAPRKYWDLYDRKSLSLPRSTQPPRNAPHALDDGVEFYTYTDVPLERPIPDDYARLARHGYFACVSFVDAQVGKLLDELDRLGLTQRTIVVLWGDHGFKLGEYGAWGKLSLFELDARVPLIIRAPGGAVNARADGLVELVDVYPTLASLAGLPLPGHLEGDSFAPLLAQPNRPWKKAVFSQCSRDAGRTGYAIRTAEHRLVRWSKAGQSDFFELYDLETDPEENLNVSGDPAYLAIQRELTQQLHTGWRAFRPRG
jgi:arylsulfatase A-like enzyme